MLVFGARPIHPDSRCHKLRSKSKGLMKVFATNETAAIRTSSSMGRSGLEADLRCKNHQCPVWGASDNHHSKQTHKSGPLLGPFLIKRHIVSIYNCMIILRVRSPLLGTKKNPYISKKPLVITALSRADRCRSGLIRRWFGRHPQPEHQVANSNLVTRISVPKAVW